jgi:hypothetical protein
MTLVTFSYVLWRIVISAASTSVFAFPTFFIGVAQSVQCLTTDWTTGVRSPTEAEGFSSSLCVQTGSGAHSAWCPMGTGVLSLGVKLGRGVMLTTYPHLVPMLRMSRSYTSSSRTFFIANWIIYCRRFKSRLKPPTTRCPASCMPQVNVSLALQIFVVSS